MTTKERPILFSAPMVRAILSGTKTQTRRALRGFCPPSRPEYDSETGRAEWFNGDEVVGGIRCPYGQPGDRLWVREAWTTHACFDHIRAAELTTLSLHYQADGRIKTGRNRAAMHMPRWASRITLEVTGVRVEKLQAISESDALAEGCELNHNGYFWAGPHAVSGRKQLATAGQAYRDLWESINGPESWVANPWVWVIEFKRINDERNAE